MSPALQGWVIISIYGGDSVHDPTVKLGAAKRWVSEDKFVLWGNITCCFRRVCLELRLKASTSPFILPDVRFRI